MNIAILKGIVSDSKNIFLWHKLKDINKKKKKKKKNKEQKQKQKEKKT